MRVMNRSNVLRMIARGWQPCLNLQDVLDLSLRIITPDGRVSTLREHPDTEFDVMFNRADNLLLLVC